MSILEWLHEDIRNEFEHFVPKTYIAAASELSEALAICLKLTRQLLFESGNVIHHASPLELENLIRDISERLKALDVNTKIHDGP